MGIRLAFTLIINLEVFRKNARNVETKTYWLSLTSKDEVFKNDGKLCYDPMEIEENQMSMPDSEYGY
jgi:hypothetical protein